jgi:mono/diheme cytochrome c family protein
MRVALGIVAALILVFVGLVWYGRAPSSGGTAGNGVSTDTATLERGQYLALVSDCGACHTTPGGKPYAGGRAFVTPIGAVLSSNITPDAGTGIGSYSLADFDRAVRLGIDREGNTLVPVMPYPSYASMTPADIAALYAFFRNSVAPVAQHVDEPFLRWPLGVWRKTFLPANSPVFDAARYATPQVARGAYLVQGPGHCGACHTPRAWSLEEVALDDRSDRFLAGGQVVDGWLAVNLRANKADGLGAWSLQDVVDGLAKGRNPTHTVVGSAMGEVIESSLQYVRPDDLQAIAAYLKTLSPAPDLHSTYEASDETAHALATGKEPSRGARLYVDNCAACHGTNGRGRVGTIPAIAGNSSVLAIDPTSMIHLLLAGDELPVTPATPSRLGMPGFAWRLSDDDVAELLTFVRSGWGNNAPRVNEREVAKVRELLPPTKS